MTTDLPSNPSAEQELLGCFFVEGDNGLTIDRALGSKVSNSSFTLPQNANLFELIVSMHRDGHPINLQSVGIAAEGRGIFEHLGGVQFLSQVAFCAATTQNAGLCIRSLREKEILRDFIQACTAAAEEAREVRDGIPAFTAEVIAKLQDAAALDYEAESTASDAFASVLARLDLPDTEPVGAVSWGIADIDRSCGKLYPKQVAVLAGRPSTGKSALAAQVIDSAATAGHEVVVFTYEMSKEEIVERIAQTNARVNWDGRALAGQEAKDRLRQIILERINRKNLHMFEADMSAARITSRCRLVAARRGKVGLVVVDYLQLLSRMEDTIGKERTDEKIGRVMAGLKQLAKQLCCPVLLLASLNRGNVLDERPPRMEDLRASGEIESDADVVALLHWPKVIPGTNTPQDSETSPVVIVDFKQEKGRTKGRGSTNLAYTKRFTRFDNYQL